jgi:HEAT repeat protein
MYLPIFLLSFSVLATAQTPAKPASQTGASRPESIARDEAIALTQGWAMLAEGKADRAASRAAEILTVYPRSAAALSLAVEASIAQAGAPAGLTQYERWLGSRAFEEPAIVRRIAVALLQEVARGEPMDTARLEALRALANDGDRAAVSALTSGSRSGNTAEARVMAAMGDARSVKMLIAELNGNGGNLTSTIEALGESGSQAAVTPLVQQLQHRAPEVRAAAADALGNLGKRYDVVESLKLALKDQNNYVRTRAAAALFGLGDMSGLTLLQGLLQEESARSRLIAAQAMAAAPDAAWIDLVRRLTAEAEPEVRIGAARLLLPHDPEYARPILERGMNDANPAIRDMASESIGEAAARDLRSLRYFMSLNDRLGRVRAAARVLVLLR